MTLRKTLLGSVVLFSCGAVANQAFAATADAGAATEANAPAQVGEVLVTARKREESLQSVPIAVTSQSAAQLQQQGIREPTDLTRNVPSLTIVSSASSPTGAIVSLRGQNASDILLTLSQPVGLYEDSVNIPHPAGANVAFFDLSRVEVLKGPQGTLYGRNTTGGAINVITRGADYSGVHGFVSGEYGNYSNWKFAGALNVPIIDDVLSARVAYQHWNREGYGHSAITNQQLGGDRDDDLFRLSLKFDPAPAFSATAKVEYVHANRTDALYQTREFLPGISGAADFEWSLEGSRGGTPPSVLVANTNSGNLFTNYASIDTFEHVSAWHSAIDASWRLGDNVTLRSITGYHQFTDFRVFDLDAQPVQAYEVGFGVGGAPLVNGTDTRPLRPDGQSRQWTQELNLSGTSFDSRLNWLAGAFYSNDRGNQNQTATPGFQILAARSIGFPAVINFHSPRVSNDTWAVFTQDDFKINDRFSITGGLRYTEEKLGQDVAAFIYNIGPPAPFFVCLAGPNAHTVQGAEAGCTLTQSAKSTGVSYLVSGNFKITPDVLFYVKTSKGFRGGALQVRAPDFPPARPETATDYEIGLKSDWFEHRLRANIALYQTDYSNKQETAIVILSGVQSTPIVNAASARIRGFEGEFTAVPMKGLTLTATVDYLHGVYQKFGTANCGRPAQTSADLCAIGPGSVGAVNASGVVFAEPEWAFNIGGRYAFPLGSGEGAIQANYAWHGRTPTTVLNNDPALLPSLAAEWRQPIGLVNASIEYRLPQQGITLSLFATNLFDKHYQVYALTLPNYGFTGMTMEPRMFGFSVKKSFGAE